FGVPHLGGAHDVRRHRRLPRLSARGARAAGTVRRGARPQPGRAVQRRPAQPGGARPAGRGRAREVLQPQLAPLALASVLPVRLLEGARAAEASAPDVHAPVHPCGIRQRARCLGGRGADVGDAAGAAAACGRVVPAGQPVRRGQGIESRPADVGDAAAGLCNPARQLRGRLPERARRVPPALGRRPPGGARDQRRQLTLPSAPDTLNNDPMMLSTPSGWSALKSQVLHRIKSFRWGWAAVALLVAASLSGRAPHGQSTALPTRGVEEVGRVYLGEALNAYIGHMAMLFVTGKHPTIGNGMMQDTVNWVNDPLHSVIADGYGGLAIYAHPDGADRVLLVDGLVGMEVYSQSYPATAYG